MDLHAPLGNKSEPRKRRFLPILGAVMLTAGVAGLGTYLLRADPRGGEPFAVATIPPPPVSAAGPNASSGAADPMPTGSIASAKAPETVRFENGVKIVSPAAPPEAARSRDDGPLVINVSKALDADARKFATLSKSKSLPNSAAGASSPRIAIFVTGLGLSDTATRTAIEIMPPAVTFAFVPYGETLATNVGAARARGHEILLQLPMQSAKGPPLGPHTLSTDVPAAQVTTDLNWLMGRLDGYVGVTNLLGAPVTASTATLTTVLKGVHQRGVFYVDDGTSKRSLAMSLAPSLGVPAVQADVVIDATGDPAVVRANLDRLASLARAKGSAIGMSSGFADHLATIARFSSELKSRGITLVPVSTLVPSGTTTATAR